MKKVEAIRQPIKNPNEIKIKDASSNFFTINLTHFPKQKISISDMDRKRLLRNVMLGCFYLESASIYASIPFPFLEMPPQNPKAILVREAFGISHYNSEWETIYNCNDHNESLLRKCPSEALKALLNTGINKRDVTGQTFLLYLITHFSIQKDESELTNEIQLLLDNGANPNIPSFAGLFPLHATIWLQLPQAAQLLLSHGANPNLKIYPSFLSIAVEQRKPEFVQLLLKYNTAPNVPDENNQTPLKKALDERAKIFDDDPRDQNEREKLDRIIVFLQECDTMYQPEDEREFQLEDETEDQSESTSEGQFEGALDQSQDVIESQLQDKEEDQLQQKSEDETENQSEGTLEDQSEDETKTPRE
jgi:ankyrin repeat protein